MSNAVSMRQPKYRHHKGKGLAVVTINGRDRYLGKYNSAESKESYRRLMSEWNANGGHVIQAGELTVVELIAAYLRFAKVYYRKNGKATNELYTIKRAATVLRDRGA